MIEVDEELFVGNHNDAEQFPRDGAVLNVCRKGTEQAPHRFWVPLSDTGANDSRRIIHAVRTAIWLRQNYPKVLIHCSAGLSRSVGIALGAMSVDMGLKKAGLQIAGVHPDAHLDRPFCESVRQAIGDCKSGDLT